MPRYRVFETEGAIRIRASDWLESTDDDGAMSEARALRRPVNLEVREGTRLVGRIRAANLADQ